MTGACCARAGQRGELRAGYIGHVTALGNKLGELAGAREGIAAALAGSPEWSIWLQKVLQPRNERENVLRWACGRPSPSDLHQQCGGPADSSMLSVRNAPLISSPCSDSGVDTPPPPPPPPPRPSFFLPLRA